MTLKKRNFKRSHLNEQDEFRVKTDIARKLSQLSSKQRHFLCVLRTWKHGRELYILQPPAPPSTASKAARVNDALEKILNLLFFLYFFRMSWNFHETAIFYFLLKKIPTCVYGSRFISYNPQHHWQWLARLKGLNVINLN